MLKSIVNIAFIKKFFIYKYKKNLSNNTSNINPWFWTGLIDAEGSFSILVIKDTRHTLGWRVELKFQLGLDKSDLSVLQALMDYLGVGKIYDGKNNMKNFVISSSKDLQILIKHLIKYPLQTQKQVNFLLFKIALEQILTKDHLTPSGLLKIVNLKASMNLGLSDT